MQQGGGERRVLIKMRVLAFHRHRLGELRAEIRVRPELAEEGFGQGLGVGGGLRVGQRDLGGATFDVGARKLTGFSVAKPKATKKDGS